MDQVTDGAKLRYVEKHYAGKLESNGDLPYCILTDKKPVRTFVSRELTTKAGIQISSSSQPVFCTNLFERLFDKFSAKNKMLFCYICRKLDFSPTQPLHPSKGGTKVPLPFHMEAFAFYDNKLKNEKMLLVT